MNKNELTNRLAEWLNEFLIKNYSTEYDVEVMIPNSNFSKVANEKLKKVEGYTSFDFHTDVLGILQNRKSKNVQLVLLNRSLSAISLKEIGEMNCYSKLIRPKHSFLCSLKGLPEEVNLILMKKELENKLLKISDDLNMVIFKWDEEKDKIDSISIFPITQRKNIK